MFRLTNKVLTELEASTELRFKVALKMGNKEQAIKASLSRNGGRAIANHYDAVTMLMKELKMPLDQIRETEPKNETVTA